jgi:DtxR family Mn-dependent transcriptional regulator
MTQTEENYLKAIYHLSQELRGEVPTNAIADTLQTKASSVTDMLAKLSNKELVNYTKYQGATLTEQGKKIALQIIRKHRLWEVFLVEKLGFSWDEVHDIAEQLEHIQSPLLIEKLDQFLGKPHFDPHGDPIPDAKGQMKQVEKLLLEALAKNESGHVVGVKQSSTPFLQHLERLNITLGTHITIISCNEFDNSFTIRLNHDKQIDVSKEVAANLFVQPD